MAGSFNQVPHTGCPREVTVNADGVSGTIRGKDNPHRSACNGTNESSWALDVTFSGGTVIADFSDVVSEFPHFKPGPGSLSGYWDQAAQILFWGDGTKWAQKEEVTDDVPQDLIGVNLLPVHEEEGK